MAIGNQLDLQIIVNGYTQAQNALQQLSGSFGQLRDSSVEYSSAINRYNNIANKQQKATERVADSTEQLLFGFQEAKEELGDLSEEGDGASERFRDLEDAFQHVESSRARLTTGILQTVGQLSQMAVMLAINVVSSLREASIEMEQLTIQLKTIGTVGEDTTASLARLVAMAKLPGIDFQTAVSGVTQLRATGISALQAEESVLQLGNALASVGGNPAELQGVVRAFTQIQSKGKVYAEEIYQIAERLPQIRKIMLDVIGTADTELLAKEGYSANQFLMMVTDGLGRLPRVADNTRNQLSNLKNEVFLLSSELGKELMPSLMDLLRGMNNVIASIRGWSDGWKKFGVNFIKYGGMLAGIVAIMAPLILAFSALGAMQGFVAIQANVASVAENQLAMANTVASVTAVDGAKANMALAGANTAVATTATMAGKATGRMTLMIKALQATTWVGLALTLATVIYTFVNWGKKTKEVSDEFSDLNENIQKTRDLLAVASDIKKFTQALTQQQRVLNDLNEEIGSLNKGKEDSSEEELEKLELKEAKLQAVADYAGERLQANINLLLAEIAKAGMSWHQFAKLVEKDGTSSYQMMLQDGTTVVDSVELWEKWWKEFGDTLHVNVRERIDKQGKAIVQLRKNQQKRIDKLEEEFMYEYDILDQFQSKYEKVTKTLYSGEVVTQYKKLAKDWTEKGKQYVNEKTAFRGMMKPTLGEISSSFDIVRDEFLKIAGEDIIPEENISQTLRNIEEQGKTVKEMSYLFNISGQTFGRLMKQGNVVVMKYAKDAIESQNDYKTTIDKELKALGIPGADLSLHENKNKSYGIKIIVKGQMALRELYNTVDIYLSDNSHHADQVDTMLGTQYKVWKEWADNMKGVLSGQDKVSEASADKLYKAVNSIQQMESLMKSILKDSQIPLISNAVNELRLGYEQNIRNEIASWGNIQKALTGRDKSPKAVKLITGLIKKHGKYRNSELLQMEQVLYEGRLQVENSKLANLDKILKLTESGLPEVARVLVDASLSQAQQVEIIEKYIKSMFLDDDGIFNSEKIKKKGVAIEADVNVGKKSVEEIKATGLDKPYELIRYSAFKNAGASLVILYDVISNMAGGTQATAEWLENLLKKQEVLTQIQIDNIQNLADQKSQILKNLKESLSLTPDSLTSKIIEATIDHQTSVDTYQTRLDAYFKEHGQEEDIRTSQLRGWIREEEKLFKERVANLKSLAKEQKQVQLDNIRTMELEISTLEKQRDLASSSDPERQKLKEEEFELEEDLLKIGLKQEALARKYLDAENEIKTAMEGKTAPARVLAMLAGATADALEKELAKQWELFNLADKTEEGILQAVEAEKNIRLLNNIAFMQGREIQDQELTLMIKRLNIQFQMNEAIFNEKRARDEMMNSAKHDQKMEEYALKLNILQLKAGNKAGVNDRALIQANFNLKNKINEMERDHIKKQQKDLKENNKIAKDGIDAKIKVLEAEREGLQMKGGLQGNSD